MRFFRTFVVLVLMSSAAFAHPGAINLYVNPDTNQLYPFQPFEPSSLGLFTGIEISAQYPGFGISFPANGIMVNESLELKTTLGLMYWDGQAVAQSTATLTVQAPTFDSDGEQIQNLLHPTYEVDRTTTNLSGMIWGTYSGSNFWEADSLYLMNPLDIPTGIYAMAVRIDSPSHEISDPFLFPFLFDPFEEFEAEVEADGLAKLQQTLLADINYDGVLDGADADLLIAEIVAATHAPKLDLNEDGNVTIQDLDVWLEVAGGHNLGKAYLPGDANLDGTVDGPDFLIWNDHKFGPGGSWRDGDFNADGTVDGQDFLVWNDHKFGASLIPAVPEPRLLASVLAVCFFVVLRRRPN